MSNKAREIEVIYDGYCMKFDGVRVRHHPNGGGLVSENAQVDESVYVGPHAQVYGRAKVSGDVRIVDTSQIGGNAQVFGHEGPVEVCGDSFVGGSMKIEGPIRISGRSNLNGNISIKGECKRDSAQNRVSGATEITDETKELNN